MTILTHAQLQDLATLVNQANAHPSNAAMREAYYQQLADDGENYGALAKGVVQGTTLAGYVADQFLKDQAQSIYGKTLSATDIQNISLCLMDADLSARQHSDNVLARPPICRIDAIWHITTRFRVSAPRRPFWRSRSLARPCSISGVPRLRTGEPSIALSFSPRDDDLGRRSVLSVPDVPPPSPRCHTTNLHLLAQGSAQSRTRSALFQIRQGPSRSSSFSCCFLPGADRRASPTADALTRSIRRRVAPPYTAPSPRNPSACRPAGGVGPRSRSGPRPDECRRPRPGPGG